MAECKESADGRDSDRESSQSEVYAYVDDDVADSTQPEIGIPKRRKKKKGKKGKKPPKVTENTSLKKKTDTKSPSPRTISSKSAFAQIAKELKARRQAQIAHAIIMSRKRKKNRVLRDEEVYTDKDRAAAVNMGTSDIKQSLKLKKKQDRNYDSQTLEEGDPTTLLALGNNELRSGDYKIALNFINKALELNPEDKNGLVARSKCYLSLGDPELALKDAETALNSDKTFVRGIYQKAEALYHLGDFEHSLMYYHQGHRLRPEQESFRLGVQKAQEAIENTIGCTAEIKRNQRKKLFSSSCSSVKVQNNFIEKCSSEKSNSENDTNRSLRSLKDEKKVRVRSKSVAGTAKSLKGFFGELGADRSYLENLLKHPDLICCNQEAANIIKTKAEEGITFLKSRQEFWRQQKPNNQSVSKIKEQRQERIENI